MMSSAWLSVLAKIRVLGVSLRDGKSGFYRCFHGLNHLPDLADVHHRFIQLFAGVGGVVFGFGPAFCGFAGRGGLPILWL